MQSLTNDTSSALSLTCNALVAVSTYLLSCSVSFKHDYLLLGFFQQDCLERKFGAFRQAAGGNYFISIDHVFAKHNIDRAGMILNKSKEIDLTDTSVAKTHDCDNSTANKTDEEIIFHDDLEEKVDEEISSLGLDQDLCQNLFYIGGFLAFKQDSIVYSFTCSCTIQ